MTHLRDVVCSINAKTDDQYFDNNELGRYERVLLSFDDVSATKMLCLISRKLIDTMLTTSSRQLVN